MSEKIKRSASLEKIFIKNFKSYKNAELKLSPLTLLIGANASGKSNVLEAMRLLNWLSEGYKLSTLSKTIDDSDKVIRGEISDLAHDEDDSFVLGCEIHSEKNGEWNTFEVTVSIREEDYSHELHIIQETIKSSSSSLYEIKAPSKGLMTDIEVSYNKFKQGKRPSVICTDQISILNQLDRETAFKESYTTTRAVIPKVCNVFRELLLNIIFLDPVPALMRSPSPKSKKLDPNGTNLSGVLYTLCQDGILKNKILEFIKDLPEQNIKDITFSLDSNNRVSLALLEGFNNRDIERSSALLSDGTLRVLAIIAALLSASNNSIIVIEEIDNGIHSSRINKLISNLYKLSMERNIKLLFSTHNPAMMDALPLEAIQNAVFCYREPETGSSKLATLSDEKFESAILRGSLGGVVTQGVIERAAKATLTNDEIIKDTIDWFNRFIGKANE